MENNPIVFEPPTPRDVPAMGRLFYEDMSDLGAGTTAEDLLEVAREVVLAAEQEASTLFCRVARPAPGAEPCGVVLANFNWSLKFGGRSLWIEELYVTPAYRRRGIGQALVDLVIDFADAQGFRGIDIEAYRGNTPASILYRSMGFHRLGRERFYYRLGTQEFL